ncbi:MAG: extracellular solute-binding protein [Burkholderiales bacterium]|nr:extracellular solute-binding protein [Burkholderiales bacterium]
MSTTIAKLLAWALFCCALPAQSAEQSWNELVAAARREGKVVVVGPPDSRVRQELPAAFKAQFGITVEYLGGRTSEAVAKLRTEHSAGTYTVDVALGGIQTMSTVLHREKMIDPLKPLLIQPEVLDSSKWKKGKLWFVDPEQQYILRLFNTVEPSFSINTREVKASVLRSARDLLDPKWKGKIAVHDPTVPGSGSNTAARFYLQFGEQFVKQLYLDQKLSISRDRRQLTDWLIHGTYPIAFDAEEDDVEQMRKEGLPIMAVYSLPDLPSVLSPGVGQVAMMKNAPHPNAAKLFINWIASKKGLEVYARARGESPTRNDIDEASFLPAAKIPRPGTHYFDISDWEFTVTTKEKIRLQMKELLRAR